MSRSLVGWVAVPGALLLSGCVTELMLGQAGASQSSVSSAPGEWQATPEDCSNGKDDDGDALVDCADPECAAAAACGCQPSAEIENCSNGRDDNCNGLVDCADPDCERAIGCYCHPGELENCSNGKDDNCDGTVDCADPGCSSDPACHPVCTPSVEQCDNRLDDDCDGLSDCQDPDCASNPRCITCTPTTENCGNGRDDDCDGLVDCHDADCQGTPTCTRDCTTTEGDSCDGSPGYGDRCSPEDNNGCSSERFWAWCNRRNDTYPDIWETYLNRWVDDRCDGQVELTDEQYALFHCTDSSGITWQCRTPLVLLLDPTLRVAYRAWQASAGFDFSGRGERTGTRHDWPTAATPWLAMDLDGDGRITSGRELFGSGSPGFPANGFAALSAFDANHDGVMDGRDPAFSRLLAWADDGDRISQPSELVPVSALGIHRIDLGYTSHARCDARGNCEVERASLSWRSADGTTHTGAVVDVHLAVRGGEPLLACVAP